MNIENVLDELTKILNVMDTNAKDEENQTYRKIQNLKMNIECERLKEREGLEDTIKEIVYNSNDEATTCWAIEDTIRKYT